MKYAVILGAAAFAQSAMAHYVWVQVDLDGKTGATGEGIRPNTNNNSPVVDLSSTDIRCNEGGLDGSSTTVRPIQAGGEFTFHSDVAVYHQGPVSVFLSPSPSGTSVTEYQGDGKWIKIADIGADFSGGGGGSASWDLSDTYTFTLPSCVPDGEYLLKIQQIGIHNPGGDPQFYTACAQIEVSGGSGTMPEPNLDIPGAFSADDPGLTANIYDPSFTSYEVPGGSVMQC